MIVVPTKRNPRFFKSFSIRIKDVYVYPQAFAAALTIRDKVKESKIVNIVDFGGHDKRMKVVSERSMSKK